MINRKRRRILVLASTFPRWAGDSTPPFVAQFCEQISKDYAEVFVLAPHSKGAKVKERHGHIRIKRFRYFLPYSQQTLAYDGGAVAKIKKSPVYALKLLSFMASQFFNTLFTAWFKRIDIINAHWMIPQGFVAVIVKFITGKKVVISVHGGDIFSLNSPLFTRFKKFVLKNADEVVVNSSATLKACKDVYADASYTVIPMGIDTDRFSPQKASKEIVKKYGLGEFTALFVGRVSEEKGSIYLCKAVKQLKDAGNAGVKALIVGDGPDMPKLKNYVAGNGLSEQVIFAGWVDNKNLAEYYSVADVFVGPSIEAPSGWKEALGLTFIEALACGVPVIATKTGGISDTVVDGKNGFLVQQKSADAIREKLDLLYKDSDLRASLAKEGRKRVLERYSWSGVSSSYATIFGRLLEGK